MTVAEHDELFAAEAGRFLEARQRSTDLYFEVGVALEYLLSKKDRLLPDDAKLMIANLQWCILSIETTL